MRKSTLGVALLATAHLAFLSTPAFAQDAAPAPAAAAPAPAAAAPAAPAPAPQPNKNKVTTGWVLVGVGGAATIAGIVVNAVGTSQGSVSGQGGVGDNGNTDNTRNDYYFVGTTLIVAGLATAFYGGSLVWTGNRGQESHSSDVTTTDAHNDSATKAMQAKLASAPTVSIPLLGARF